MIRLKTLLEQYILPKAYAYNGHIVIIDPKTNTPYHYKLEVDLAFDISVTIIKIDLKSKTITYKHPINGNVLNADLQSKDIAKIAQEYNQIEKGDAIEGLETTEGRKLLLTRIS